MRACVAAGLITAVGTLALPVSCDETGVSTVRALTPDSVTLTQVGVGVATGADEGASGAADTATGETVLGEVPGDGPDLSRSVSESEPLVLTPEGAARLAVRDSLDLQLSAANIRRAEADVIRALGLAEFGVSASGSYGRSGPSHGSDPDSESERISFTKQLYIGGRLERSQAVAKASLATTHLNRDVVARVLDLSARELTYEVLRAEQLLRVAVEQANAMAEHLELSKQLLEAGTVARFEVVQAETELARAQGEVIAARTQLESRLSTLKRLLTVKQYRPVIVQPGETPELPGGSERELTELGRSRRPEVLAAAAGVRSAEARLRLAFASRNVSVDVGGSLNRNGSSAARDEWTWQLSISATKPIFDRRGEESEVKSAKASLDAAKVDLEQTKEDVALDVTQAVIAVTDARERLRVADQGMIEAQERLSIARVRFETGYALGIEVLDAQTALTAAQVEQINADYNLQVAVAQLRSAIGLWAQKED